tara:strand:- start:4063 stop:4599 length:537 start_codon:yes stop_codon:yes gene_type:complete
MTLRIAIVGSRKRAAQSDRDAVEAFVATLPADAVVVSGGAAGIDTLAAEAAERRGLAVEIIRPEIPPSAGRRAATKAFHARNVQVVERSDVVVAFASPERRGGTEHTIRVAKARGLPVFVELAGDPCGPLREASRDPLRDTPSQGSPERRFRLHLAADNDEPPLPFGCRAMSPDHLDP